MKRRGAELAVQALQDEGVRWTFGIPGTHNTELYDALEGSSVQAILVTDEQSAGFMADAVSRSSGVLGVANVVPGAGVTHCLSGIAEAFMDNIPMLVLTCGIRNDTGRAYQLHDVDQLAMLRPVTKAAMKVERPEDIYAVIRRACALARSGCPGPVAVEVPANYYVLAHEAVSLGTLDAPAAARPPTASDVEAAAKLLNAARRPAIYAGFGAKGASALLVHAADALGAPVCTTIQGKGVFPESHPFWLWNGFGAMAPRYVRELMDECDCLLAIGCRFGEVATASYGLTPPKTLIHVDIDGSVFNRNFPAALAVEADAADFLRALVPKLSSTRGKELFARIAEGRRELDEERASARSASRVSPAAFFPALQAAAGPRAIYTTDSGNGTFLAMEHLRLDAPGRFLGPIDYSCMGYAVPAAIGAKLANPEAPVAALAGDGALLMTGLELLTAARYGIGVVAFVLRDEELGQIAQFQRASLDRADSSALHPYRVEDFAKAAGCAYRLIARDADLAHLAPAFAEAASGRPVMVEVAIDYSQKTYFTRGALKTNFWRLPWGDRLRAVARVLARKLGA
ncbi:MAG: thiamine pyrophosphate-binding protein [Elusimicrobia bacterium]|nr:thiamine pyrophosphate-binding protein [Elusimicrobiota bacterium]